MSKRSLIIPVPIKLSSVQQQRLMAVSLSHSENLPTLYNKKNGSQLPFGERWRQGRIKDFVGVRDVPGECFAVKT